MELAKRLSFLANRITGKMAGKQRRARASPFGNQSAGRRGKKKRQIARSGKSGNIAWKETGLVNRGGKKFPERSVPAVEKQRSRNHPARGWIR